METKQYLPRLIEKIVMKNLELYGAVLIEGCKWCGKSTTARELSKSVLEMQNPATAENNQMIARSDPMVLLAGEKPRLIDEWQDTPMLWDAVRYDVDKSGLKGQYILTGSSTPRAEKPKHTGTGRIARVRMRPLSLFESGDSNGSVSLGKLLEGNQEIDGSSNLSLADIARLAARGGFPVAVVKSPDDTNKYGSDYLESVLNVDSYGGAEKDIEFIPNKMRMVIRSLARNISMPVTNQTIMTDALAAGESISDKTLSNYLDILTRLFILDDVTAWSPYLRSKTTIRSGAKRNFVDPSLVVAALSATETDLRLDYRTFGLVFESMSLRDLKIYAESLGGHVYYYRDKVGRECDAIVHLPDGRWGAIEIKLGTDIVSIEAGIKTLTKFVENVDTEIMHQPAFLVVLTAATNYAYRDKSGVYIVPIGCLRD